MSQPTGPSYPLVRGLDDPRFTNGLIYDIGEVLTDHGYPPLNNGDDIIRFQMALFNAIYADAEVTR